MADKESENTVRFTLITGQGHLITFNNEEKEEHSPWDIRTSYKNTLSTKEVEEFGELVKACVDVVNKVL